MLTGKKYGEVLAKASPSLRAKIEHSVELVRKAERLALIYDPADGFHLAFSAGKDSQALYHIAEIAGVKFKGHMSLTSVDPPEVIRFAKQYYPEVELKKPQDSIFNVAVEKGILPTMRVRWCCNVYKENEGAGKVTLIGIRHSESTRRAKRKEVEISDRKYSGTLEGLDEYRKEKLSRKRGRKPKNPKPEAFNINTVQGESQAGCISGKESLLISPIIDWEEKDVWEFLRIMEVPHCPLYDEGWKRLGCIGCPMSSAKQKAKENERWPHVRRNWIKAIIAIRRGGVSQGERTNHKTNLGIWTGEFLSHSGGGTGNQLVSDGNPEQEGSAGSETLRTQAENAGTALPHKRTDIPDWCTEEEWEIAEAIYDWWCSGVSYAKWYSDRFHQQKLDFGEEDD